MNYSLSIGDLPTRRVFALAWLSFTFCVCSSLCGNESGPDSHSLVQQALQAEVDGDHEGRQELLSLALHRNSDDSTARWLSGYVKHDNQWMTASRSAFFSTIDDVIMKYEELRDRFEGSHAGEISLARWCRRNDLNDRERMHWRNVIAYDSANVEARKRLKMRNLHGQLMTQEEIETFKDTSTNYQLALRVWGPKLKRLRREIERNKRSYLSDAWSELAKIDDPDAIPAMSEIARTSDPTLQRHLIRTIANIQSQAASNHLVQLSLNLQDASARQAAAEGLAEHPVHSYAPQYLTRLESTIEYVSTINQVGDSVISQTRMRKERPDDAINVTQSSRADMRLVDSDARGTAVHRTVVSQEMRLQQNKVANTERTIENNNAKIKLANDRIFAALRTATGEEISDVPKLWWDWWKNYNEYMIADTKPEYHFANTEYRERVIRLPVARSCECFPAGTLVHTETGKRAIETIRRGDKVLSQDPESGELAFQVVTQTTVRPPSATTQITVAGEEITSTDGHPFWVIGKGWTMAKDLDPGDRLQSIGESKMIEVTEGGTPVEAHNLIVDRTNSYFVGNVAVLVHDNILRSASRIPIPGWQAN